ncbi:uncharacterized protein RHIMIDRAFT_263408, partial [Rhizopus microsporus ATCC 52813]
SRNGSKRTRSRLLSGYLNDNIPLQAIPTHTTFYLCDHAGADKKKAKNSTGTIDATSVVSSVDNDQGSRSNELDIMRHKETRIAMKSSIKIGCIAKIMKHVMTDGTIHVEYHWEHPGHCLWNIKEITKSRLPFEIKQWIIEKISENMDWKTIVQFLRIDDERLIGVMMLVFILVLLLNTIII